MREKSDTPVREQSGTKASIQASKETRDVPYDASAFFESFYKASVDSEPTDLSTIGVISEPESRFHYNVLENSLIRAVCRHDPPPAGAALNAWRFMQRRRELSLLDIGSGTGHWIDFFRDVFFVKRAIGVELTSSMAEFLEAKYKGNSDITILQQDVSAGDFRLPAGIEHVDYVSAIGVMFHIVDDEKFRIALDNLGKLLNPAGLLLVGGNFGLETRNVQFHKTDHFSSWSEHSSAEATEQVLVNKRVRSLADWIEVATACDLEVCDLIRSDSDSGIMTPENDVLVLRIRNRD